MGDQITIKGVFSQEANMEAERIMKAKNQFITMNATNIRTTTIEAVQCLYMMSRWKNPNENTKFV